MSYKYDWKVGKVSPSKDAGKMRNGWKSPSGMCSTTPPKMGNQQVKASNPGVNGSSTNSMK